MVCNMVILFPPCDNLSCTGQYFIFYCCSGIDSAGVAGGECLAQHCLHPPCVCVPHCGAGDSLGPSTHGAPLGSIRAGPGSPGLSHRPRQQQGSWGALGAAPAPGIGHLPGDRVGLGCGPAGRPGLMGPMARQGRAVEG